MALMKFKSKIINKVSDKIPFHDIMCQERKERGENMIDKREYPGL